MLGTLHFTDVLIHSRQASVYIPNPNRRPVPAIYHSLRSSARSQISNTDNICVPLPRANSHRPLKTHPSTTRPVLPGNTTMCTVHFWKSHTCRHRWMTIQTPCAEGRNFSNCPSFKDGKARRRTPFLWAPAGSCPQHDENCNYNFDTVRILGKGTRGVRIGRGPSLTDPGVDVPCCSVM